MKIRPIGGDVHTYTATVSWSRNDDKFTDGRYNRAHEWSFDGGVTVPASPSPQVVRVPYSNPANVDPEEAFVAALSSCHMLSFLPYPARHGFIVESYTDEAEGIMEKNEAGRLMITRVTLHPQIVFSGPTSPSEAEVAEWHHLAHEDCYLANSVKTSVETAGSWQYLAPVS